MVVLLVSGCDACDKKKSADRSAPGPSRVESRTECSVAEDCADDSPCTTEACLDGHCAVSAAERGASCDNDDVCDGVARCDARGRCVAGAAPTVDDGNPCTLDDCDKISGVSHKPLEVDDFDACTEDACDSVSGHITHEPVDIDDGDDCTFDSCDPKSGPEHRRPKSIYTCDASCGDGFHAVSRRPNRSCGARGALQTFCVPDCGPSFYLCGTSCPKGYRASKPKLSAQCGAKPSPQTFCIK